MLNILKYFQQTPVEKYEFQEAETLPFSSEMQASGLPEFADPSEEIEESVQEPQPDAASNYAEFAKKVQEATEREAEEILDKARAEADAILESARTSANREAEALCEQMREKGYRRALLRGVRLAMRLDRSWGWKKAVHSCVRSRSRHSMMWNTFSGGCQSAGYDVCPRTGSDA